MKSISNSQKEEFIKKCKKIRKFIGIGEYNEALSVLNLLEKQTLYKRIIEINKYGWLIDIGFGLKDVKMVKEGIDIGKKLLQTGISEKIKAQIHYNLANGYISIFKLTEYGKGVERLPQSNEIQKAKNYFRKSIKFSNELDQHLQKQLWTNYGNCLDLLGRSVESIDAYDKSLKIDPNFSMAIANRSQAMRFFADISGEYRIPIYVIAYQTIKSVINNRDIIEIGGVVAKQSFENELNRIESRFKDKKVLEKKLTHSKYDLSKLSNFERFYIDFCTKERLFLNFHIHEELCETATTDPIFISLITSTEDHDRFFELAKHINQIKEDFAVARFLLVQSQYKSRYLSNISQRTIFVNTLDYSEFNLYLGLLKSSFKEAYNILDKIAFFVNDYLKLSISEKKIYFTSKEFWQKDNKLRYELLNLKNRSLYALYDIYLDFKSKHYGKIRDIRNNLTHRKLVIYDSTFTGRAKKRDKDSISYQTMFTETVHLLQLVRSAIIYLINFVNAEENKKYINKKGFILPVYVNKLQL
ncbi:hypothetical protein KJA15_04415 [Patescibacteria group bacterium]|nr:hypothetical protein [Patescibacteria group bacterium]